MRMNLKVLQKSWDFFGKTNPMWAILMASKNWKEEDFFTTGVQEVQTLMEEIAASGIHIGRERVLDFGCGIGRLSQAFAGYFNEVCGIDISPSMIEAAKKHNLYPDTCKYYLNCSSDLRIFADNTFDLIYSNITLQHVRPRYTRHYIKEFLRVLSPGGLLVFQLPDEFIERNRHVRLIKRVVPPFLCDLYDDLVYKQGEWRGKALMEMHGIKIAEVIALVEENGGKIVEARLDHNKVTSPVLWASIRYSVVKCNGDRKEQYSL